MSNSVRPHRQQPTRLPHPWDSPAKNTGAGCHFLLQCMKVKRESEVAQSCPTLSDLMDCSLPGSSIHRIFHARVLEWDAIAFSEYVIFHGKVRRIKVVEGIKVANQLTLSWGDYFGLSQWDQCYLKGLYKCKREAKKKKKGEKESWQWEND